MRYGLADVEAEGSGDRTAFPSQSSVLDEQVLKQRIVGQYAVENVITCRFLSRGDADIYRVVTEEARCYLKIYRPPCTTAQAEGEARLVEHLAADDVPVVRAIQRREGSFATEVHASEGVRPILMFEEAPPALPRELGPELMAAFGTTVARVHRSTDAGYDPGGLPAIDLDSVMGEWVPYIRPFATSEDIALVSSVLEHVGPELAAVHRQAPEWGLCHADLVISNARSGPHGRVTLFDFGNAATTYRGLDLAVVYWNLSLRHRDRREVLWEAFLGGYERRCSLPRDLHERLPLYLIMRELMFLGGNAASLPLRLGTEPFESDFMQNGFERLRQHLASLSM